MMISRKNMSLTSQDIDLLKYLIQQDVIVSVKNIGEFFDIDERSIRYRVGKIQQFLAEMKLSSQIRAVPRRGIFLTDKVSIKIYGKRIGSLFALFCQKACNYKEIKHLYLDFDIIILRDCK